MPCTRQKLSANGAIPLHLINEGLEDGISVPFPYWEITPARVIDRMMPFDDYLMNEEVARLRAQLCQGRTDLTL